MRTGRAPRHAERKTCWLPPGLRYGSFLPRSNARRRKRASRRGHCFRVGQKLSGKTHRDVVIQAFCAGPGSPKNMHRISSSHFTFCCLNNDVICRAVSPARGVNCSGTGGRLPVAVGATRGPNANERKPPRKFGCSGRIFQGECVPGRFPSVPSSESTLPKCLEKHWPVFVREIPPGLSRGRCWFASWGLLFGGLLRETTVKGEWFPYRPPRGVVRSVGEPFSDPIIPPSPARYGVLREETLVFRPQSAF